MPEHRHRLAWQRLVAHADVEPQEVELEHVRRVVRLVERDEEPRLRGAVAEEVRGRGARVEGRRDEVAVDVLRVQS